jgi:hypothetical protein
MSSISFWKSETGVNLREGENLICSPLRKDAHPSFAVNTDTGLWFDHGTGQGGNIFDFVMVRYGFSFQEAKKIIEQHCGILPEKGAIQKNKGIKKSIKQGVKEDYCFFEIVKNGIYNRGVFKQLSEIPDYYTTPGAVDCFHSIYRHSTEIVSYQNQHGDLKGYSGSVWCSEMVFDIDRKEGTIQENISKALEGLKKLVQVLKTFGLLFRIKFSGNKGFHCSFSLPVLDKISGFTDTPQRVELLARKMARSIEGIDFQIYSSATHLIRSLNSINSKSGFYAIPLTEADIYTLSPAQIIELAAKPRKIISYPVQGYSRLINESFSINADGSVIFQSGVSFTKNEIGKLRNERNKDAIKKIFFLKNTFQGEIL